MSTSTDVRKAAGTLTEAAKALLLGEAFCPALRS